MQRLSRLPLAGALYAININIGLCLTSCHGLCIVGNIDVHTPFVNDAITTASSFLEHYNSQTISISAATVPDDFNVNILSQYKQMLATNPLPTKMITGGVLAVAGDAIAQSRDVDKEYDVPRAVSFLSFDMCYRALQHGAFPIIVEQCRGQYFSGVLSALGLTTVLQSVLPVSYLAAMEQTLASQLGIVPFLYYPVFFSLTGLIQGLTTEQSLDRAKENFFPLMKRNLLFWIPVQFIQFGFVQEGLQIPFLSACGLAWTYILSIMAGSTKKDSVADDDDIYDIDTDELFPTDIIERTKERESVVLK